MAIDITTASREVIDQIRGRLGGVGLYGDETIEGKKTLVDGLVVFPSLSSDDIAHFNNLSVKNIISTPGGNSDQWNDIYTAVLSNSANWDYGYDVATYVQANSASWEGSAEIPEILSTVTNYLSTNNVLLDSATVLNTLSTTTLRTPKIAHEGSILIEKDNFKNLTLDNNSGWTGGLVTVKNTLKIESTNPSNYFDQPNIFFSDAGLFHATGPQASLEYRQLYIGANATTPNGADICRFSSGQPGPNIQFIAGPASYATRNGLSISDIQSIFPSFNTFRHFVFVDMQDMNALSYGTIKIGSFSNTDIDKGSYTPITDAKVQIDGNVNVNGLIRVSATGDSLLAGNSNQWNSAYTTVQANSASWGGSTEIPEILPTVTNYLSTNNVLLSSATVTNTLSISSVQIRTKGNSNLFIGNSTTGRDAATGNHNFVFGIYAGSALTTGSHNNFFGINAGRCNTTGIYNNFFGFNAGLYNTTGDNNNFFGNCAGYSNTTGRYNNFFGPFAGYCNTTGRYNNFFGSNAGGFLLTGDNNNFFGINAGGLSVGGGNNNNFFGTNAGAYNTTGSNNNFFGIAAGFKNTTGGNNNFFGTCAGLCNTTGINNNFFGNNAGLCNTTGSCNNFFGFNAGCRNFTGFNNNFFGRSAGCRNFTGFNNNFFGSYAGSENTTGNSNNFFGFAAGYNNTSGGYNNFFGVETGGCNTTGTQNNFFGFNAGFRNTTGSSNNFFGCGTGYFNTIGGFNNFFGYLAGCINTVGSNNIIIGTCANVATNSLSGVIVIGTGAIAQNNRELAIGSQTWPLSTVVDTTLTGQVSSVVIRLNNNLVKIPIIPV